MAGAARCRRWCVVRPTPCNSLRAAVGRSVTVAQIERLTDLIGDLFKVRDAL